MKKEYSALEKGINIVKYFFLFVFILFVANEEVQQAQAQSIKLSFIGNSFNITPSTIESSQLSSGIAYNDDLDQWLVVWQDERTGVSDGIYGRIVDKDANLLFSNITIIDNSDTLAQPSAAYDTAQSRYFVVWVNNTNGNIEGRILNAYGALYDAFMIVDCTDCRNPDVVYSPSADKYLVVWDESISVSDKDVKGRFIGVDGVPDPGGPFDIAVVEDTIEQNPAVVVDPSNGRYLVVFSHDTTGNFNVGGQRLFNNGSKNGGIQSISSDAYDEKSPDVAFNPTDDGAFIAWHHDVDVGSTEIKGRLLRADNSMGSQPTLSISGGSDEQNASLSYAFTGDPYLVTWDNGADIFGRWVTAGGAVASDIFIVTSTNTQYSPSVAFGLDRFLVSFNDWSGQYDVWGRFGTANPRLFLPIVRK